MGGKKSRLRKALDEAGLGRYSDVLEEAEVTDAKTMESLTEDDWAELVEDAADRDRFDDVMQRLRQRRKQQPRPQWRPAGANKMKYAKRSPCMNPAMDAVQMETRRAVLRKAQEATHNPAAPKELKAWAAAATTTTGTTKVNLTGTKWHLKPHDTVRVLPDHSKLNRCVGSLSAKKYPKTLLSCGKTGEVVDLQDAVVVRFDNETSTSHVPHEALEMIATRLLSAQQVAQLQGDTAFETHTPQRPSPMRGTSWGTPTAESPGLSSTGKTKQPESPAPQPSPQDARVARLEAEAAQLRRELAKCRARPPPALAPPAGGAEELRAARQELCDIMSVMVSAAQTLGSSSALWASQLATTGQDAEAARSAHDLSAANTNLQQRLEALSQRLDAV